MPATSLSGDEHVHHVTHSLPADRTRSQPRLPAYLTPFIGREREIDQATGLLQRHDVRLLTLTGPGGIGKTRLALRLAAELETKFGSAIYFVPLSTVTDLDLVLPAIARAIEIPDIGGHSIPEVLKKSLRDRRVLLILDNFEHVIDAAAQVTDLMTHCPDLTVIVTSRVVLRVQGEQEFAVPPLATPARGPGRTWNVSPIAELTTHDAIALFVQRAQSVQPTFTLNDNNALAVAEICTRLDGLPLAIELAAARIKILTPSSLLTRLSNRLQVLTSGARDQPERLRTMRNAIAWSYDLLTPAEQALFQALSVFANDFTLEAAESVVDQSEIPIDTLDGIASLVDSSLLRQIDQLPGERRFRMLSTIREFGLEQLAASGKETVTRRRHADWCLALAERVGPEIGGSNIEPWLNLEREHDNLRAALTWLLAQGDTDACARIAFAIWAFWLCRSHFKEGRSWFERILEKMPDEPSVSLAHVMSLTALFTEAVGDFSLAQAQLEVSLRMAADLGDNASVGVATFTLGDVLVNIGEYDRAEPLIGSAIDNFREIDDHVWLVTAISLLGMIAHWRGDDERARSLVNEALTLSRERGFIWGIALCLNRLGRITSAGGDYAQAAQLHEESLTIWQQLGDYWRITRVLIDLADFASASGQLERAARLLGAAEALNEPLGVSDSFTDGRARSRALAVISKNLDADTLAGAWQIGRGMSWDEAMADATASTLIAQQSARQTPVSPGNFGLTAREMEVLQLLAAGYSDRQIAEDLYISRRTAQGHVASIFNKLGVNSRTAAATAALRAGLVEARSVPG